MSVKWLLLLSLALVILVILVVCYCKYSLVSAQWRLLLVFTLCSVASLPVIIAFRNIYYWYFYNKLAHVNDITYFVHFIVFIIFIGLHIIICLCLSQHKFKTQRGKLERLRRLSRVGSSKNGLPFHTSYTMLHFVYYN